MQLVIYAWLNTPFLRSFISEIQETDLCNGGCPVGPWQAGTKGWQGHLGSSLISVREFSDGLTEILPAFA